jgi:hypothetical protein
MKRIVTLCDWLTPCLELWIQEIRCSQIAKPNKAFEEDDSESRLLARVFHMWACSVTVFSIGSRPIGLNQAAHFFFDKSSIIHFIYYFKNKK